jgi:uncharacterized protein YbjT (DUF2867 family)
MTTTLITGGTGTLGVPTVAALRAAGHTVRVLSRTPRPHDAEFVAGDLLSGVGLDRALTGIDVVVHCATTAFDRNGRFGGREVAVTRTLLAGPARSPRPAHLVYISIVGIDAVPLPYYTAKLGCETLVRESGVPWTILRATQFHDLIARIVGLPLPVTLLPAHTDFQPIDVREVAGRLTEPACAAPVGNAPDIGGPQVLPLATLARQYHDHHHHHHRRPILSVPLPGRIAAGYRGGAHTAPDNPYGTITFRTWLDEQQ